MKPSAVCTHGRPVDRAYWHVESFAAVSAEAGPLKNRIEQQPQGDALADRRFSPHRCPCPLMASMVIWREDFSPLGVDRRGGAFISLLEAPRLQVRRRVRAPPRACPGYPAILEGGPHDLTTWGHKPETSMYLKSLRFARGARPRVTPRVTEPAQQSVWAIEACRCRSNAAAVSRLSRHRSTTGAWSAPWGQCSGRAA